MPYDPRPVSKGGNRGAGDQFQLRAPKGKFRVIGVDTFDGEDWVEGDFDTLEEAQAKAESLGGNMQKGYVYNDQGNRLADYGSF